ncbi:hypothetical protein B566_EDAN019370 [Ephemera danica]|nr:hypothetical protein B566_EDAN019370 [Ephemera danica]
MLPEAIDTDCSKCSERQKAGAEKVLRFLVKNKPAMYQDFAAKYDPMGMYKQRHHEIFEN